MDEVIEAVLAIGKVINSNPTYAEKLKKMIADSDKGKIVECESAYESYLLLAYDEYLKMEKEEGG